MGTSVDLAGKKFLTYISMIQSTGYAFRESYSSTLVNPLSKISAKPTDKIPFEYFKNPSKLQLNWLVSPLYTHVEPSLSVTPFENPILPLWSIPHENLS